MTRDQSFAGTLVSQSTTELVYSGGRTVYHLTGSFTFVNGLYGTVTGFSAYTDGILTTVASGLFVDAVTAVTAGGSMALDRLVLVGNVTESGSAGNDVLLVGTGGFSQVNGGGGIDTAVLQAGFRTSTVSTSGATIQVATTNGSASLTGIANVAFVDGRMTFDTTDHASAVNRLYNAALGRSPDQTGLAYWNNNLAHGASLNDLSGGFLASNEFAARFPAAAGPDSGALIDQLYQNVLHRAPDASGKAYWVKALDTGANTRAVVLSSFSESAENQADTANVVASGLWVADPVAAQIARLYDTALGRLPDFTGLSNFKTQMEVNGQSLNQVAAQLVASSEYQTKFGGLSNQDFVTNLYGNALGTGVDTVGLASWLKAMSHGFTKADVIVGFSESAAHIANTAANVMSDTQGQYGIKFSS